MAHGLFAPLQREEENTLRRIAYGVAKPQQHFTPDVSRLRTLSLIDECDGLLRLTPLGLRWISGSAGRHTGTGLR
jgi:hypothetical protein